MKNYRNVVGQERGGKERKKERKKENEISWAFFLYYSYLLPECLMLVMGV